MEKTTMADSDDRLFYLRDLAEIEPPRDKYDLYDAEDIYKAVPPPAWAGLAEEIWVPRPTEGDPAVERMRALIRRNAVAKRDAAASRSPGDRQIPMGRDERSTLLSRAKVGVKSRDRRGSNKPRRGAGKSGVWGSKSYKGAATRLLNHPYFEVSILFLTIWALFAEDVRLAAFSRPTSEQADVGFWGASLLVAAVFAAEVLVRSAVQDAYIRSFYFWLDVVAAGAMVPDCMPLFLDTGEASGTDASAAARAGRIARAGTKVGRLLRLLRVVRVIRLLFTSSGRSDGVAMYNPSQLGRELKSRIAKTTVLFILLLLCGDALLKAIFERPTTDATIEVALAQLYLSSRDAYASGGNGFDFQRIFLPAFLAMFERGFPFVGAANVLVRLRIFGQTFYAPPHAVDMPPLASCTQDARGEPIGPYAGPVCRALDGAEYGAAGNGPATAVARLMDWQEGGMFPASTPCSDSGCYPFSFDAGDYPGWLDLARSDSATQHRPLPAKAFPPPYEDASPFYPLCSDYSVFQDPTASYKYCPWSVYHLRVDEMFPVLLYADGTTNSVSEGFNAALESNIQSISSNNKTVVAELWYTKRPLRSVEAVLSVLFTLVVCAVLGAVSFLLSRDAEQASSYTLLASAMVIQPIEKMVDAVTRLAANPAYKLEAVQEVRDETDALYASLIKIASLLQVGFGEAGNNLVAENLKKGDTVDPMVPGRVVKGAFAFCIIDNYEEVLECLGEEILPFTNTAAEIVHGHVVAHGGQANRNLGEAFLCVWKPSLDGLVEGADYEVEAAPERLSDLPPLGSAAAQAADTRMCDGALTAIRNAVRSVQSSAKLQAYNGHAAIIRAFDRCYSTKIGYGLHFGWAIEGAVGTNIKIDCSYLSPNVNLAARLEQKAVQRRNECPHACDCE